LKLGTALPGTLSNLSRLKGMLMTYGVLFLAVILEVNQTKYKHVIVVLGVDEDTEEVGIVNPWKQNPCDFPVVQWPRWSWIKDGIFGKPGSATLKAGCQFLKSRNKPVYWDD